MSLGGHLQSQGLTISEAKQLFADKPTFENYLSWYAMLYHSNPAKDWHDDINFGQAPEVWKAVMMMFDRTPEEWEEFNTLIKQVCYS